LSRFAQILKGALPPTTEVGDRLTILTPAEGLLAVAIVADRLGRAALTPGQVAAMTAGESAVFVRDDGRPAQVMIVRQVAHDAVEVTYLIGGMSTGLNFRRGLWDMGIRRVIVRVDQGSAIGTELRRRGFVPVARDETRVTLAITMPDRP
jgi:hypothetical protein